MIMRLFNADLIKIRKKGLWFLVFLAPLGLVAMNALNFGLRLDYLQGLYGEEGMWDGLLGYFETFVPLAIMLGATILSSMMAGVEYQQGSWKQLLALPVSRRSVFLSKFSVIMMLLLTSCVLLFIGVIALGLTLGFNNQIPWMYLLKICFLPLAASLPLIVFLFTLTLAHENQALSVTVGITLAIAGLFSAQLPEFIPLSWPMFSILLPGGEKLALYGIGLGVVLLLAGMMYFGRKEVA
ncbi:ABC transporter permease [Neobacillus mesonae]|nr:ABC transporter permease [Neobacillus mesonae]